MQNTTAVVLILNLNCNYKGSMITLKDGSKTKDSRLTRIIQFDEKSREYPVTAVITNQTPRSYTWQCNDYFDQGQEGACTGFAFAHELVAKPSVVSGITPKFARETIYWEAQKADEWPGGAYPGARPFYEGTSVLAAAKQVQKLGYISEYRWAFGLDDLILAVGRKGPAVLGVNWYDSMYQPYSCGFLHVEGEIAGGHAILCKGVNITDEYFILHNSWGPDWGVNGDAKISFGDMERLLSEDGEACIPLVRKTSAISSMVDAFKNLF